MEQDDVVLARAIEFSHWARANVRLIVGAAVLLVVVVGGLLWWRAQRDARLQEAATGYMFLEQQVMVGTPAAQQELERYIARFSGTPYADEASVLLGQVHLQQGNAQAAIDALREPAGSIRRSPVGAQAAMLMAAAQQQAGDAQGAEATYLRVGDQAEMTFRQMEALMAAATLREQAGNHAGAAELYGRLAGMSEENSMDRSVFEMRQAEAAARAGQAPAN